MVEVLAPPFSIAGRPIGAGHPTYIVAELSANHLQDFGKARQLVREAAAAGADAIKLQTYTADTITLNERSGPFRIDRGTIWEGSVLHDLYREAATPWDWHLELFALALNLGLHAFATPFDTTAIVFLEKLGVPAYKVASFEIVDIPLLMQLAATGKPIILSTGMATLDEIEEAVVAIREVADVPLALLRASSAYPAPSDELDLRGIDYLAKRFGVVAGLSDHTLGHDVARSAVALGACIVEKHLTLSRSHGGPDAAFSLEPAEFREMVAAVRGVMPANAAHGALPLSADVRFGPSPSEEACLPFRRSLFVVRDVAAGGLLTEENVRSIRPAAGLHPRHFPDVLGRRAACDLKRGTPLAWALID